MAPGPFELAKHGAVDDLVADLHLDATDDARVEDDVEVDLLAVDAGQGCGQSLALRTVELDRARDRRGG